MTALPNKRRGWRWVAWQSAFFPPQLDSGIESIPFLSFGQDFTILPWSLSISLHRQPLNSASSAAASHPRTPKCVCCGGRSYFIEETPRGLPRILRPIGRTVGRPWGRQKERLEGLFGSSFLFSGGETQTLSAANHGFCPFLPRPIMATGR